MPADLNEGAALDREIRALSLLPDDVWEVAYDGAGKVREGAWVAELTGVLGLSGWPNGMRVIARSDDPQAGHAETSPRSTVRPAASPPGTSPQAPGAARPLRPAVCQSHW